MISVFGVILMIVSHFQIIEIFANIFIGFPIVSFFLKIWTCLWSKIHFDIWGIDLIFFLPNEQTALVTAIAKCHFYHIVRKWSRSVMSNSLRPHGLQPIRLLHPWDSPGKSAGVDGHFPLQGIFPTQESNPGLPHCTQTIYCLSLQGSPYILWNIYRYFL